MEYDYDKIDECTLALLYLVTYDREENLGRGHGNFAGK